MTDFAHSLAVVIGIDAYRDGIPRLTTAVNDATRLAGALTQGHPGPSPTTAASICRE